MAVDTSGLADLVKNIDLKSLMGNLDMADSTGGIGAVGGGVLGGLLTRAFVGNGFGGGYGMDGGYGNRGYEHGATPAEVQGTVGFINTIQDINSARRDIFQSQGQLQQTFAQGVQTELIQGLQGQIATLGAINNSTQVTGNAIDSTNALVASGINSVNQNISDHTSDLANRIDSTQLSIVQGQATINQNINDTKYQIAVAVANDGDKTRALIESINNANLNRQLVVADNRIAELLGDRNATNSGITVTNNISQAQAQAQQQQQLITLTGAVQCLLGEVQRNTQSVVNLGTMTGTAQTAANTRVN